MVIPRCVLFAFVLSCFAACHTAVPSGGERAALVWRACAALPGKPSLRGLSALDDATAWVSGEKGTIARTTDGGASWQLVGPPDAATCDFRDIEAFDAKTAVAMVAGQPARVYRTTDGGVSWRIVLEDPRKEAFFDGIAFAGQAGLLFGDPIDGAFCVWTTRDGGETWTPVPREQLPAPLPGEAAFAASGTCVAVSGAPGHEELWVATGGGPRARVLHRTANGWSACDVPMRAGAASQGGFGLAVHGAHILLVGGDYAAPTAPQGTAARSDDGGRTWRAVAENSGGFRLANDARRAVTESVGGFRSAVSWINEDSQIAVGSHGATLLIGGDAVSLVGGEGFHCLSRARDDSVWAAGSEGRVAKWPGQEQRLRLTHLFGDHMVLPAASEVQVRGRAMPGATVRIDASWGARGLCTCGGDGAFACALATPAMRGGPHAFTVTCESSQRTVRDVLAGDVWLASGQSNMEMSLGVHGWSNGVRDHEREEAAASYPTLRVFTVKQSARELPADDVEGEWVVCSPATASTFSATAYLFASELVKKGVQPLGVVVSSWGGTVCEAWTSEQGLTAFPEFAAQLALQRMTAHRTREQQIAAIWATIQVTSPYEPPVEVGVPGVFSKTGLADFDGLVSYSRSVDLPTAMRGKRCWLELGAIDDYDEVWCNGQRIGSTDREGAWRQARRYELAPELTRSGVMTLNVNVLDTGGEGGFAGKPEELRIVGDDPGAVVPLAGTWSRWCVARLANLSPWPRGDEPNRPAVLWNGMIAPLLPFPFTGAIWYQGEANRDRDEQYSRLFPAMIRDWRRAIGSEIPFYFVQIAPFGYENDRGETAALREAQAAALQLPHTGMVVTLDCGDAHDIHPIDKRPVGERLAALALARHYGRGGTCEGPTLRAATRRGDDIVLTFAHTDGGMQLANGGAGWEIAGRDGVFAPANARVDGDDVVLASPADVVVTQVRYAWAAVPAWSLRNGAGFPAPPFRAAIP